MHTLYPGFICVLIVFGCDASRVFMSVMGDRVLSRDFPMRQSDNQNSWLSTVQLSSWTLGLIMMMFSSKILIKSITIWTRAFNRIDAQAERKREGKKLALCNLLLFLISTKLLLLLINRYEIDGIFYNFILDLENMSISIYFIMPDIFYSNENDMMHVSVLQRSNF